VKDVLINILLNGIKYMKKNVIGENNMTLKNGRCDSCNEEVGFLFLIAVIQELPTGGEEMIVRYYCKDCYEIMSDAAQDEIDDKDEDEEEEESDEGTKTCSCCDKLIKLKEDEDISEYFCFGCAQYICESCSLALEIIGSHTIEDHRKACRDKNNHS